MSQLNHKGPENLGPKTGRKLGKCKKPEDELKEAGELGKGQGMRRHAGGGKGRGKRLRTSKNI